MLGKNYLYFEFTEVQTHFWDANNDEMVLLFCYLNKIFNVYIQVYENTFQ